MRKSIVITLLLAVAGVAQAADYVWYDGSRNVEYTIVGEASPVVKIASEMFSDDILQVTGRKPVCSSKGSSIRIVQLDKAGGRTVKSLARQGVPTAELARKKDAFYLSVNNGITIVGSNGRGTAYGLLELSRMAGVSPWIWWGDVKPVRRERLAIEEGFTTMQSPSVEYRGVFINDEDFTLRPWSNTLFEKSADKGQIGPRTNRKIFELLLRLRANTIWPAMHTGSTAFFKIKGNKEMADSCGIVVGTSHCEPLLRNNVDEWKVSERGNFNYITNKEAVQAYWAERLKEVSGSGDYYYTIGMRGIHDGHMEGVKTMKEKTAALQQVIIDQRELLRRYIGSDVTKIPQVFVPYKEVLQIMENGLDVPDDITLMWCDDNYGYMTRLSDSVQQQRKGGAGVYYHLSYWGQPHDYMWLQTEQPGLIYNEMREAYDHNARKLWIVNVHEPKVAAYGLELFLDMAWNINSVTPATIERHMQNWYAMQFGEKAGAQLLPVMKEYYRLCAIRRPEFMGWCQTELDKKKYTRGWSPIADTDFSMTEFGGEMDRYMEDYESLKQRVAEIEHTVRPELRDAYYAAVKYPVYAAAAMAVKHLEAQKARRTGSKEAAARSMKAHEEIKRLTDYYNNTMSGGRWKGMMNMSPRNLYVFGTPVLSDSLPKVDVDTVKADTAEYVARNASDYTSATMDTHAVQMLGHSMNAISLPKGGTLAYDFTVESEGDAMLYTGVVPTQPNDKGDLRYSVCIDGAEPVVISLKEKFRSNVWKENVLRCQALKKTPVKLAKGRHRLEIKALDNHILIDQWMIDFSTNRRFYMIPVKRMTRE